LIHSICSSFRRVRLMWMCIGGSSYHVRRLVSREERCVGLGGARSEPHVGRSRLAGLHGDFTGRFRLYGSVIRCLKAALPSASAFRGGHSTPERVAPATISVANGIMQKPSCGGVCFFVLIRPPEEPYLRLRLRKGSASLRPLTRRAQTRGLD